MAEKHTVAMFVQGEDGRRVQVGWASPKDASGVRTFEYSPGYEETRPKDVSFEDDELSQQVAEEQHEARKSDGSDASDFEPIVENEEREPLTENIKPVEPGIKGLLQDHGVEVNSVTIEPNAELAADPITEQPDPEQADDPTDAGLDEDEEFVELDNGGKIVDPEEDEEAEFQRLLAQEEAEKNQPQTRRELRENEGDN